MRTLLVLVLLAPAAACTKYQGAVALQPAADSSTWVYIATNRDRRTGVYFCEPPKSEGAAPECTRVVIRAHHDTGDEE